MSLYLQSNELTEDVWWILGALIALAIVFYLTKKAQYKQRADRLGMRDPRQNVVNDSSYNINQEGIDGHRTEGLSEKEAQQAVKDMRQSGELPNREEFNDLRKDLK